MYIHITKNGMQNYCKAFANKEFEFAFALQFLKGKKKGQEEP
jgi:hypothetical protein